MESVLKRTKTFAHSGPKKKDSVCNGQKEQKTEIAQEGVKNRQD